MAIRSIATAKLSFGLVTVPVRIFPTGEPSSAISFNWLHKDCGHRLKQQFYCPEHEVTVPQEQRVKGYQFRKGEYVIFTPEELKALQAKSTQTIDIDEFVAEDAIDPVYVSGTYYLGPDKGGDKAYQLLSAALQKTKRIAVARYAARGKQYLVAIRPKGKGLVMEQLYYEHEIKPFSEVPLGEAKLTKREMDLAVQLVHSAEAKEFDPGKYEDEVRERILENIQKKVEGEDITSIEEAPRKKILDLMEALEASVGPARKKAGKGKLRRASRTKARKRA